MVEGQEVAKAVGEALSAFVRGGPQSPLHAAELGIDIVAAVRAACVSVDDATASYKQTCEDTFRKIVAVRGMPTAAIVSTGVAQPDLVSSSGKLIADHFDELRPNIQERLTWCVQEYDIQAQAYFSDQIDNLLRQIMVILRSVPVGGGNLKSYRPQISQIKREVRCLGQWDSLFYTFKAASFLSEVDYLFQIRSGAIAAIWHYNDLDEQGDHPPLLDHRKRDQQVYVVRGNWAITKGLMTAGTVGFLDDITRPKQQAGCMCWCQFIYGFRNLPPSLLTDAGRAAHSRARALTADLVSTNAPKIERANDRQLSAGAPEVRSQRLSAPESPRKGWFRRLLGF